MADSSEVITQLLAGAVEDLDLPIRLQSILEQTYDQVGLWMTDHLEGDGDWTVYPQGSARLGTTVRPTGKDEYDIDSVAEWDVAKDAVSKDELKHVVGDALKSYVQAHAADSEKGAPTGVEPGRRCWTLEFDDPFHMDVLPAIPNRDAAPTGIWITDRDLLRWQESNPKGYADWFFGRAGTQFTERRSELAKAASVDVHEIPAWRVKTALQRTVQVFKQHRNLYFAEDLEARPPSIMITTLIAHAYAGQTDLFDAVMSCAEDLPRHMRTEAGIYVVENPVQAGENFAERFSDNEEAVRRFQPWLADLLETLEAANSERGGLDRVIARLEQRFGTEPVQKAASHFARSFKGARSDGALNVASTGAVTTGAGLAVRDHTFYGD